MRQRVEYVIYYIEIWSIVLDLHIIALTMLSPKVYRNAF
jgi:lipopolysaccharide/colanic/teichoic acid biosynthesis glycosyltransferase